MNKKYERFCVLCGKPIYSSRGLCHNCIGRLKALNRKMSQAARLSKSHISRKSERVSVSELLWLKEKYSCTDVLCFATENFNVLFEQMPKDLKQYKQSEERRLNEENNKYTKSEVAPSYILQLLGEDERFLYLEGDRRNPTICCECLRCHATYCHTYEELKGGGGHFCDVVSSSGEIAVKMFLDEQKVDFLTQRKTLRCVNPTTGCVMPYDFEISKQKVLIEVQGEQHKRFIPYFHVVEENFIYQQKRDKYKREFTEKQGYTLIEIWYDKIADGSYKTKIINAIKQAKPNNKTDTNLKQTIIKGTRKKKTARKHLLEEGYFSGGRYYKYHSAIGSGGGGGPIFKKVLLTPKVKKSGG